MSPLLDRSFLELFGYLDTHNNAHFYYFGLPLGAEAKLDCYFLILMYICSYLLE